MAKKRVIAYFMHEHEHSAALAEMPGATSPTAMSSGKLMTCSCRISRPKDSLSRSSRRKQKFKRRNRPLFTD